MGEDTLTSDRNIVDEIDLLVDEQMANYSQRSGYDRNVNQPKCPHEWCTEEFHGLAITSNMAQMRRRGMLDPEYRYADDNSVTICPGSTFVGEFTPPINDERLVQAARDITFGQISALMGIPNIGDGGWEDVHFQFPRLQPWQRSQSAALYELGMRTPEPDPIIDMDTVRELQGLHLTANLPEDHLNHADLRDYLAAEFEHHARTRHPGIINVNGADLRIRHGEPDHRRMTTEVEVTWWPETNAAELQGGPSHGRTHTFAADDRYRDVIYTPPPASLSYADYATCSPITRILAPIEYRRAGWNTATRRWVYRCVEPEPSQPPPPRDRSTVHFASVGTPLPVSLDPMDTPGWQALGTIEPGSIQFTPDSAADDVEAWGTREPWRTMVSRAFSVDLQVDSVDVAAWQRAHDAWIAVHEHARQRDMVVAPTRAIGRDYAREHGLRGALIISRESQLRGLTLDGYRLHVVGRECGQPLRPEMLDALRVRASGRPLESFYANTTGEQAA